VNNDVRISVRRLMLETFTNSISIYFPMLAFSMLPFIIRLIIKHSLPLPFSGSSTGSLSTLINEIFIVHFFMGASYFYAYQHPDRNSPSIIDSILAAMRKIFHITLLSILVLISLIPVVCLLLIFILPFIIPNISFGIILFCPILVVLIVLELYFWMRWTFALHAIMLENCSIVAALNRSWKLTKGRFWLLCRAGLLYLLVFFMPVFITLSFVHPSFRASSTFGTIGYIFNSLVSPLSSIYYLLLFINLVSRFPTEFGDQRTN
jgi:hypothetical protein